MAPALRKVKTLTEAAAWRESCRARGERVVFANGCFDLLHGGHVAYLEASRAAGDRLLVGVNSDSSERTIKGPTRPIVREDERLEILDAIRFVDALVVFDEPTCERLLRRLRPDVHAKGTDYTAETVPEREVALELGIEILIAGPPKENASRAIVASVLSSGGDAPAPR